MFALLTDLMAASMVETVPFKEAYKRVRCIRKGHTHEGAEQIDRMFSEKHPNSNDDVIFCTTIYRCTCGVLFTKNNVTFRIPLSKQFPYLSEYVAQKQLTS